MHITLYGCFQFLGIPPKGERLREFDIREIDEIFQTFPISRDPPEGGTFNSQGTSSIIVMSSFQFLGIPPKGERFVRRAKTGGGMCFQFLGIPPKGERLYSTWKTVERGAGS